ncbi:MAG: OmpA family protein [Deltaproteobacteria bacterium]|nr:OmpA family protein [Deltaproteobacteria bacterium]
MICRSAASVVVVVALALSSGAARAEETRFPAERFRPSTTRAGLLDVEWGGVGEHMQWDVALWGNYALNPLVVYDGDVRAGSLVAHRFGSDLVASVALFDWIEVAADLPLVIFQTRDTTGLPASLDAADLSIVGVGDLRVAPKVRLLRSAEQLIDLAIIPAFTLPILSQGDYVGEAQATFVPELAVSRAFDDGAISGLRLAGNVAYRYRPTERSVLNVQVGSELLYRAGVGFRLQDSLALPLELDVTVAGGTYANAPFGALEQSPLELLAGVKYDVVRVPAAIGAGDSLVVTAFGGAGTGLLRGFGTPDLRVFGGLSVGVPTDIDHDDDGIADRVDACKGTPEDKDGHDDVDGCPDPDNDGDTVLDTADKCPNEAEDADGFDDDDGCPDPDNDGDSVKDGNDKCVGVPGPAENAGCPWPDTDGDGILDKDDVCKDIKGVAALKGCPDADADGITDAADRCPTIAGPAQPYGGCPDTDGDGFTDDKDKCPADPETVNNVDDDDGCPDEGKVLVTLTKEKIVILDKIFFDNNKATIKSESFFLLDQVATVVRNHSDIHHVRIEGHTDDKGADDANLKLSQERADSVKAYLVGKGIDAARLAAVGYGETRPVGDNKTKDGKEQNRRVEFVLVNDDDVDSIR